MDSLSPAKQRYAYWDNIKGLLIALVVFAHCLYAFQSRKIVDILVDGIYFFHMPAFVFVSGFFSKRSGARSARALLRLLVAYLLLMAVHLVMALIQRQGLQLVTPMYSSWYLLALIAWRLVTPYFSKVRGIIPLAIAASFLAGLWGEINNTLALARIISFYPFFLAGYFWPQERAERMMQRPLGARIPAGAGLLIVGGALAALTKKFLDPVARDYLFSSYQNGVLHPALVRAAIFAIAFACSFALLFLSPSRKIPILTKAGKNSLAVYLIHRPDTFQV